MLDPTRIETVSKTVRERIVDASYPMFIRSGIRDVTPEKVQLAAGVTAEEFNREFASRDDLGVAALDKRERDWTVGIVAAGALARGTTPETRLLAIFDVFDEWFHRDDYEACTFVNVLLEMGREHPLGQASIVHLHYIRHFVESLALEAGLIDIDDFGWSWHILMKGAIISAAEGDAGAARRARAMARDLIDRFSPVTAPASDRDPAIYDDIDWDIDDAVTGRRPNVDSSLSFDDYH
ncbi:AcrR family transcriptional regulator [Okibacterium sp. HSC-33S16]|uniref:TetR/AcrR family transcriptional regulator n=1 Tax=Okibacterium sp. HSC-33S16 TaxID=2910965 RepID=UPI0020A0F320|nr:TetR/AcrR family transcriptional regulator [Okibacterium sp. HSC-33S16]MCP2031221.1 AcrR family transcriptional regulator [Okibacterium sp. HSC-33S16]